MPLDLMMMMKLGHSPQQSRLCVRVSEVKLKMGAEDRELEKTRRSGHMDRRGVFPLVCDWQFALGAQGAEKCPA